MPAYNILLNLLHTLSHQPLPEAVKQLVVSMESLPADMKQQIDQADLRAWAKAMHSCRADGLSVEDLLAGLEALGKFNKADILAEIEQHFIQIAVHIDTESMCRQYDVTGNKAVIDLYYQQQVAESEQPELKTESKSADDHKLLPDCTIDWQFITSRPEDSLQLKAFYVQNQQEQAHCSEIKAGQDNALDCYRSYESRTAGQMPLSYFFDFTINNMSQLFRAPAFKGELS